MNGTQAQTIYVTVDYQDPNIESLFASLKHKAQKMNAVIKDQSGKVLFQPQPKQS